MFRIEMKTFVIGIFLDFSAAADDEGHWNTLPKIRQPLQVYQLALTRSTYIEIVFFIF